MCVGVCGGDFYTAHFDFNHQFKSSSLLLLAFAVSIFLFKKSFQVVHISIFSYNLPSFDIAFPALLYHINRSYKEYPIQTKQ